MKNVPSIVSNCQHANPRVAMAAFVASAVSFFTCGCSGEAVPVLYAAAVQSTHTATARAYFPDLSGPVLLIGLYCVLGAIFLVLLEYPRRLVKPAPVLKEVAS